VWQDFKPYKLQTPIKQVSLIWLVLCLEVSSPSLGAATHPRNPKTGHTTCLHWAKKDQRVFPRVFWISAKFAHRGPGVVPGVSGASRMPLGAAWSSTSHHTRGVNTTGLHVPARKGLTLVPNSQKLIQIFQMATY